MLNNYLNVEKNKEPGLLPRHLCDQTVYLYKWKVRFFTLHSWIENKASLALPIVMIFSHINHLVLKSHHNIPLAKKIDCVMHTLRNASLVISSLCLAIIGVGVVVKKLTAVSERKYSEYIMRDNAQLRARLNKIAANPGSRNRPILPEVQASLRQPPASVGEPIPTSFHVQLRAKVAKMNTFIDNKQFSQAKQCIDEIRECDEQIGQACFMHLVDKYYSEFCMLQHTKQYIPKDMLLFLALHSRNNREQCKRLFLEMYPSESSHFELPTVDEE